ncbi:MAG: DUF945 family protein [Woeseia sp.]
MKRWLLASLIGLALLVFLAPGIIGMLAERSLEQQLEQNSRLGPQYAVRELNFARGWFTSAGRHRVPIADASLARFIAAVTPGAGQRDAPALIIETRLEHGLVPLGSAPRSASSLLPALATGVSTLALELPDGSELPVPGVLYSRIGLTGSATFRYELPAGSEARDSTRIDWQASDVTFSSNSNGRELGIAANLPGLRFDSDWQHAEFSAAEIEASSRATPWGFAVGDVRLRLADANWKSAAVANRLASFELEANSAVQNAAAQGELSFKLLGLETPDGAYDIELAAGSADASAELLGPVIRGLQYSATNQQLASGQMYPGFDTDLRRLLSAGFTLNLEGLQLRTPDGDALASIALQLPRLDEVASWPGLLLALSAQTNIELARARVETPSPFSDQLRMLIAGGFLVLDGDMYRMQADYAKGKATINGAPLAIPLELLR